MYDVIVVGAGHAGCEAALAAAKLGQRVLVVTGNINLIASMPCNPSIGGPAKGIVVREIDALGGIMAKIADATQIQMRLLNHSKGPAVRALRAQSDKHAYSNHMKEQLLNLDTITLREDYVEKLLVEHGKIQGVKLENGEEISAQAVVITAGTYLNSKVLVGDKAVSLGPDEQKPSLGLSPQLKALGFKLLRLKTGTPPRLFRDSINFSKTIRHDGDNEIHRFAHYSNYIYQLDQQYPCYLTYTTEKTHAIINDNLHKSSMYSGIVEGVGPRYCPSIEDKIVRFKEKERHQIFLEPESSTSDLIYVQGFSTSMPNDVQDKMIRSVIGLENAEISKYGYAIEYDAIDARQLWPTLESKDYKGLYFAGQINGTSGYEEAAGQGLMAGINVARTLKEQTPVILRRDEAYIGVLIDDLVTKGTIDPYRLLTSRAEHRLLLRHDNADLRLMPKGYEIGLVEETIYEQYQDKQSQVKSLMRELQNHIISPNSETNNILKANESSPIKGRTTLYQLVKRPEISSKLIEEFSKIRWEDEIYQQADIHIKYEGYILKASRQAEKSAKMEAWTIPENIDYDTIDNLANEAKDKLKTIRPRTIGQASRIGGVNPSDISILLVNMRRMKMNKAT